MYYETGPSSAKERKRCSSSNFQRTLHAQLNHQYINSDDTIYLMILENEECASNVL